MTVHLRRFAHAATWPRAEPRCIQGGTRLLECRAEVVLRT